MRNHRTFASLAMLFASLASTVSAAETDRIAALETRLAELERRVTLQEDIEKVRVVAYTYAYFADNVLYDEIRALFSPSIESCESSGYGVF